MDPVMHTSERNPQRNQNVYILAVLSIKPAESGPPLRDTTAEKRSAANSRYWSVSGQSGRLAAPSIVNFPATGIVATLVRRLGTYFHWFWHRQPQFAGLKIRGYTRFVHCTQNEPGTTSWSPGPQGRHCGTQRRPGWALQIHTLSARRGRARSQAQRQLEV